MDDFSSPEVTEGTMNRVVKREFSPRMPSYAAAISSSLPPSSKRVGPTLHVDDTPNGGQQLTIRILSQNGCDAVDVLVGKRVVNDMVDVTLKLHSESVVVSNPVPVDSPDSLASVPVSGLTLTDSVRPHVFDLTDPNTQGLAQNSQSTEFSHVEVGAGSTKAPPPPSTWFRCVGVFLTRKDSLEHKNKDEFRWVRTSGGSTPLTYIFSCFSHKNCQSSRKYVRQKDGTFAWFDNREPHGSVQAPPSRRGVAPEIRGGLVASIEARGGQPKAVRIYPSLFRTIFVFVDVFLLSYIAVSILGSLIDRLFSYSESLVILPFAGPTGIHPEKLRWHQRRRLAETFPDQEPDTIGTGEVIKRPDLFIVRDSNLCVTPFVIAFTSFFQFLHSCFFLAGLSSFPSTIKGFWAPLGIVLLATNVSFPVCFFSQGTIGGCDRESGPNAGDSRGHQCSRASRCHGSRGVATPHLGHRHPSMHSRVVSHRAGCTSDLSAEPLSVSHACRGRLFRVAEKRIRKYPPSFYLWYTPFGLCVQTYTLRSLYSSLFYFRIVYTFAQVWSYV